MRLGGLSGRVFMSGPSTTALRAYADMFSRSGGPDGLSHPYDRTVAGHAGPTLGPRARS